MSYVASWCCRISQYIQILITVAFVKSDMFPGCFFEIFEEVFTAGIIEGIAFLEDDGTIFRESNNCLNAKSIILRFSIMMEHKPFGTVPFIIRLFERGYDQINIGF